MRKFLNPLLLLLLPLLTFSQNVRISDMPAATNLTGAYIPIIQGGINKKAASSLFGGGGGGFTLTTIGNSGSSTFLGGVLNIPIYTLVGLGGITLNDLSATAPLTYNSLTGQFSMTEVDPVASAINGILRSNGTTLSAVTGAGYSKFSGTTQSFISSIPNSDLTNSVITINGVSTALGSSITQDQITGLASTGIIKRTGANALAIAVAGTDYQLPATTLSGYGITDAQPLNSNLTTIAGLTPTTNNFIVSVGSAWASRTPTQVKSTLAIANTDVSGLGALATITPGTGVAAALGVNIGSAGAPILFNGAAGTPSSINLSNASAASLPHSAIAATAVTPGSYISANITVAADGSITAASNGGGTTTNPLTVDNSSLQLNSGTTFDGSTARTISVKANGVTNSMLAGSIDLTSKVTGLLPNSNGGAGTLTGLLKASSGTVSAATPRTDYTSSYPTVSSTASTSSITPDPTVNDLYDITALAVGLTINNPSTNGNGYAFVIRVKDNSTPQTLTWGSQYRSIGGSLPTTTTASTTLYAAALYNLADSKWDVSISPISPWLTAGTTNLTAPVTVNSTTPSGLTFSDIWTATANNQIGTNETLTLTQRATASDNITGNYKGYNLAISSTTQNPVGLNLDVNFIQSGGISAVIAFSSTTTGMTATTYTNVAPANTSGSGTGALFNITATATTLTITSIPTPGSGYRVNETVTFNGNQFGSGTGSAVFTIRTIVGLSLGTSATPLRIGVSGSNFNDSPKFIDFWYQGVSNGSIGMGNNGDLSFNDNSGTTNFKISNAFGATFVKGFTSQAATTFSSTLALSNVVTNTYIPSGIISSAPYLSTGVVGGINTGSIVQSKYKSASSVVANGVGFVNTVSLTSGGTGYTTGTKATTGGTGTGCTISVTTVSGGVITVIAGSPIAKGSGYSLNDVLTVSTGGGNATVTVTSVDFAGVITSLEDANTITDASSNNIYATIYSHPTYNITSAQTTGGIFASYYNGTHTATGSFGVYNHVYTNTGSKGGIGNSLANVSSTWDVNGSIGVGIVTSTGNLTLDLSHSTVIITSGTGTYTLPAASAAGRRIYRIVNQTGSARTISTYTDKSGATQTTVGANSSLYIQSDGSTWYQIN